MSEKIDMSPAVLDLVLYAGDGSTFAINFVDDDDQPIDVSYMNWAAQIRKTRKSEDAQQLEIDDSDAVNGIVLMHISAEVTRSLSRSSQWDIQGNLTGEDPITLIQGSISCKLDVTREEVTV
jgi:hypothetical protein